MDDEILSSVKNPLILQEGRDILESDRFRRGFKVIHHKETTMARHSLAVTEYALYLFEKGNYPGTQVRDLVRACLLHDIGMTDMEIFKSVSFRKAYSHPKRSAEIAIREFGANAVQVDAILHHMWPICIVPPSTNVGWLLTRADKHCTRVDVAVFFKMLFDRD